MRRTKEDGQSFYESQLDKAARNCEEVLKDLKLRFNEFYPFISILPGYHALAKEIQKNHEHKKGEPDILIRDVDNDIIAGVEVTGSEKINFRDGKKAWVAAHKMDYARSCGYPVGFVLFYRNGKFFVDRDRVEASAPYADARTIGGYLEYYHIVPFHCVCKYDVLKNWLLDIIKRRMA